MERRITSLKKFQLWFDAIDIEEACFPSPEVKYEKPEMKAVVGVGLLVGAMLVVLLEWLLYRFIILGNSWFMD